MKPNIDFLECLKDSPRFRGSLEEAENDVDLLEAKLEKLIKLCNGMIEAGKVFNNANGAFIHGVRDVAIHFKDDDMVSDDALVGDALEKFTHNMAELQKYHNILLDQAHRSISKNLNNFIKNDIKKLKDTRKHFEKISDDMDNALNKNASAPRSKAQECEDANNVLIAMKSCFAHTSLDYVFQINILHSKKRFDILDTMLAYMHAQNAYFHQGFDLFADLEPYMKTIASQLEQLSGRAAAERKEMEERHSLVQKEVTVGEDKTENSDNQIKVEGYLFKRTSNAFKSWVRRWFMIQNNHLVYRKRSKDNLTIMEEDLRLCTVKPAYEIDRRYCFEVVSPSRSHMLQADSEQECQLWITAIQAGVSQAYRDSPHKDEMERVAVRPKESTMLSETGGNSNGNVTTEARRSEIDTGMQAKINRMEQILSIPGNEFCCDCGSPDPRWASINLGITLCIECSGIHRSFGVHMSKVRSVTLDAWEPELIKVMLELGNTVINRIYEANVDENVAKHATPQCSRPQREAWIRAKYIQKAFVRRLPFGEEGSATSTGNNEKQKRWSVQKRRRRSPGKQSASNAASGSATPSPGSEDAKLVQGESQDSGLGGSTSDVIVFGASVNTQNGSTRSIDLEDSEGSSSETEVDPDTQSTTSFEELSKLHPDLLLYKAAQARNLPVMLEALAQGANPNWSNPDDEGKTPLIKATESDSMAPCELILLNGAKVDRKDLKGRSALHHATVLGHTGQVCQFLKRNANQHAVDEDGNDPLSVAVKNANADIVTLLRLAKLNEEMKETEGFLGGPDETFTEVFRDFTNMANNTPERLTSNNK